MVESWACHSGTALGSRPPQGGRWLSCQLPVWLPWAQGATARGGVYQRGCALWPGSWMLRSMTSEGGDLRNLNHVDGPQMEPSVARMKLATLGADGRAGLPEPSHATRAGDGPRHFVGCSPISRSFVPGRAGALGNAAWPASPTYPLTLSPPRHQVGAPSWAWI